MEIDRTLLQTMIREYWAVDNNDICENATIVFLRKIGLSDEEIQEWTNIRDIEKHELSEAEEMLSDAIKDTKNYFSHNED